MSHAEKSYYVHCTFFSCSNPDYVMWRDQEPLLAEKFYEVECGLGGLFQVSATKGWPLCDSLTPEKCNDFPKLTPNQSEIIEIMNPDAQLPGKVIIEKSHVGRFLRNRN